MCGNLLGLPAGKTLAILHLSGDAQTASVSPQITDSLLGEAEGRILSSCRRVTTEARVTAAFRKRCFLGFSCQPQGSQRAPVVSWATEKISAAECLLPTGHWPPSKALQQLMLADRPVYFWLPSQFAGKHGRHAGTIQALPPFVLNRRAGRSALSVC